MTGQIKVVAGSGVYSGFNEFHILVFGNDCVPQFFTRLKYLGVSLVRFASTTIMLRVSVTKHISLDMWAARISLKAL
jgi:hypothetical protein